MLFDTIEDATRRLASTVIRYKDRPVYVERIRDNGAVDLYDLLSQAMIPASISKDEKLFNIKPIPLGYINYCGNCFYSWRIPSRRSKQGLHRESFMTHRGNAGNLLTTRELGLTVVGEYPSIDECKDALTSKSVEDIAFSRQFALHRNRKTFGIRYKGTRLIGYLGGDDIIRMAPGMGYFDSLLREVVGYERYKIM